jgi:hypothetical protein
VKTGLSADAVIKVGAISGKGEVRFYNADHPKIKKINPATKV